MTLRPEIAAKRQAAKRQEMAWLRKYITVFELALDAPDAEPELAGIDPREVELRLRSYRNELDRLERYCGLRPPVARQARVEPQPQMRDDLLRELARLLTEGAQIVLQRKQEQER